MKKFIPVALVAIVVLLAVRCEGQDEKPAAKLESFQDSLSYSIGVQVAEMIKRQGDEVNAAVVAQAVREALEDTAQMTMEESQAIMQSNVTRKTEEAAEGGLAFLAENGKKEGVTVTASGLHYKTLTEGTGTSPTAESTVTFHYTLTLTDGNQIQSSYDSGQPITYPLTQLIPGWAEGLQLMKVGGKMELIVPSNLGYGPNPSGPIPGGSVLVFEVELLSIGE